MNKGQRETLRCNLQDRKRELSDRLERIHDNLRRGLEADSAERAKQLEDREVVDALDNDAREELAEIAATLARLDTGEFGQCESCGAGIGSGRLRAYPYATECIDCAKTSPRQRGA